VGGGAQHGVMSGGWVGGGAQHGVKSGGWVVEDTAWGY
jgi:hypothetical protein